MTTKISMTSTDRLLEDLQDEFGVEAIQPLLIASERWKQRHPKALESEWSKAMILESLSNIDEAATYWTFVAARIYLLDVYACQENRRSVKVYTDFAENVEKLAENGLYTSVLMENYT